MPETISNTVIGESIVVNGKLSGDENLTVVGRGEGSLDLTSTLNVEAGGIVKAEVSVNNAIISGVVVGNISAKDCVEITQEGRMVGDIRAPRIIIIEGARFRGNIDMGDLEAPRSVLSSTPLARPAVTRPAAKPTPRLAAPAAPVRPAAPAVSSARPGVSSPSATARPVSPPPGARPAPPASGPARAPMTSSARRDEPTVGKAPPPPAPKKEEPPAKSSADDTVISSSHDDDDNQARKKPLKTAVPVGVKIRKKTLPLRKNR